MPKCRIASHRENVTLAKLQTQRLDHVGPSNGNIDMRVVFIGSVLFSRTVLTTLRDLSGIEITGIVTRSSSPHGSDFTSLTDIAETMRVPCLEADDTGTDELSRWIGKYAPDVIFCVGWNRILPVEILEIPTNGVIGYHPAALPHNRGRHPIIWALARGLPQTASTFFLMDEGADTGAIVDQEPVPIGEDDDAGMLYARLQDMAPAQLQRFVPKLLDGTLTPKPQNPETGNNWRKRSAEDGRIDWRMSAVDIRNLVRALAPPYPGATCQQDGRDVVIHKVEIVAETSQNLEPGKILEAGSSGILVKCGDCAVRILEHDFDTLPQAGRYL